MLHDQDDLGYDGVVIHSALYLFAFHHLYDHSGSPKVGCDDLCCDFLEAYQFTLQFCSDFWEAYQFNHQ
jgi:hypothetical protein